MVDATGAGETGRGLSATALSLVEEIHGSLRRAGVPEDQWADVMAEVMGTVGPVPQGPVVVACLPALDEEAVAELERSFSVVRPVRALPQADGCGE